MIFNAFQREDDDAVFTVVQNISNGDLAAGDTVVWDSASPDGVRVTVAAAATLSLFRGIVAEAIVDNAYGKVQVHGYCTTAKVTKAVTVTAGDVLIPVATALYLIGTQTRTGTEGFIFAAESRDSAQTSSAATKVLIRAL